MCQNAPPRRRSTAAPPQGADALRQLPVRPDIVYSQHVGNPQCRRPGIDRQRSGQSLPDGYAAEQPVEERLARHAEHQGRADLLQLVQVRQQVEVVLERLAEPDPGIDQHLDSEATSGRDPLGEEVADLGHHVVVAGLALHRARLALHVHGDHRSAVAGRDLEHRLAGAGDVVDQVGAGSERPIGDLGLRGVDAQGHSEVEPADALDHRQQPGELLRRSHRIGAGPGAFGADVDQVGPFRRHAPRVFDRGFGNVEAAAVREAVRRHVEHPHDEGPIVQGQDVRAADEVHGRSLEGRATNPQIESKPRRPGAAGSDVVSDSEPWVRTSSGGGFDGRDATGRCCCRAVLCGARRADGLGLSSNGTPFRGGPAGSGED